MPLTTTATWPTLTEGKKAKASEVEAKFDWLEGHQYPMIGGEKTTGVYDIGSSSYTWKSGYFSNVVVGGITMTAEGVGVGIKAWGNFNSAATALGSYNVDSVVITSAGSFLITWTTPFNTNAYSLVATPAGNAGANMTAVVYSQASGSSIVYTLLPSGTLASLPFSVIAIGNQ